MAIVHIRINDRDYDIACDDGQEEQLRILADDIDDRVRSLVFNMGTNPGEAMALLLASLTMADEIAENKREIDAIGREVRQLRRIAEQNANAIGEEQLVEMENAMAHTLNEVAARIEKIAEHVEMR